AERGDARNFTLHDLADLVLLEPVAPDVVDLLDAERDAAIFGIDLENLRGDGLAFLEDFVRILDALGPADVTDVDEALDALFELDEDAVVDDADDLAFYFAACGIFFGRADPRIVRELFQTE